LDFTRELTCMPFMKNGKRDYRREVDLYTSKPEVIRKRVEQNKARRLMEKAGKVSKGDGKDVDHKTPLSKGGKTTKSNLRVVSRSSNRSFRRNSDSSLLNQISKKGK
jgi:5-methylcytosine-specific restriction endonuclease McrA